MTINIRKEALLFEDFCNIPKSELEKIINEFFRSGYPNPVSEEEVKNALRRYNL